MCDSLSILAAASTPSEDLLYVLAVVAMLVLAGLGALVEKLKREMAKRQDQDKRPPVRGSETVTRPVSRPPVPPRPAYPQHPAPRPPVIREAPAPRRPIPPRQVPTAAPARPPQQVRRVVPERPPTPQEARPSPPRPTSAPPEGRSFEPQVATRTMAPSVTPSLAEKPERIESKPPVLGPIARQELRPAATPAPAPEEPGPVRVTLAEMSLADIRRAIVLNEVLGLPVALRDPDYLARQA